MRYRQTETKSLPLHTGFPVELDEIVDIANTVYFYDPGFIPQSMDHEDEKILIKLDWNINDDHRAVLTYQTAEGDVIFDDFPTLAALQSNRYNINEKLESTSLQLFSNWTDNFSTEIKLGDKSVENRQVSVDNSTPEFIVASNGIPLLQAGGDKFRQRNFLNNESDLFRIKGDFIAGDHIITAGFDRESKFNRNLFTPGARGSFTFDAGIDLDASLDLFEARDVGDPGFGFVLHGGAPVGEDADKSYTLDIDSFYVQDEWTPSSDLTLTFGFRYDKLSNSDDPIENDNFVSRYQFSNTENLDGKDLFQPRFGFNYDVSDRLTIRGGAGLFGGGAPLIILSNVYIGDGISRNFSIQALSANLETKEVQIRLKVRSNPGGLKIFEFWIGYFDFPTIDNVRLSDNQRCALVLRKFEFDEESPSAQSAKVLMLYFPGDYASLKDKPYIDDMIRKLGLRDDRNGLQSRGETFK